MKFVISSGHGKYIRGASGYLDEVDEARRVVERTATILREAGADVTTFHDDVSNDQSENLERIVDFHNSQSRDLDISVHFNAYQTTDNPMGTECLYVTQEKLADDVAEAISASCGLIDRGPKKRTDLYFLNNTNQPAILIETCFVDSVEDADIYDESFEDICTAIASAVLGRVIDAPPPTEPSEPMPPAQQQPTIGKGDSGAAVKEAQHLLNAHGGDLDEDGDFGPATDSTTRTFQSMKGLTVDGIIGPNTWTKLYEEPEPPPPPGEIVDPLPQALVTAIGAITEASSIASYSWRDRGLAPIGYIKGMAVAYGTVYRRLKRYDAAAIAMAVAEDGDRDSLAWYHEEFAELGMSNAVAGPATLRHLWVLALGLGMRESSGRHCEGRDMSADNVTSDTAEAGMHQTSWNAHSAHPQMDRIFEAYRVDQRGYLNVFNEEVACTASEWESYGSGDGRVHQDLSKVCPQYHVEFTALGMRYLGGEEGHWGPIRRHEAEIRREADLLFLAVQALVEEYDASEVEVV